MPRVGTSVAEQTAGGSQFTIEEGNVEVTGSKFVIDQVQQNPARVTLSLTVRYWNKNWSALEDREEVTENLSVGPVLSKDGARKFGVGLADGPDDNDPELEIGGAKDAGEEVETEGNCLLSATGAGPDKKSKLAIFCASLEQHGFPAAMNNGYAPNYLGLKLHVTRLKLEKGADYTGKNDPTALVCGLNGQIAGGSITQMPGQEAPAKPATKTPPKPAAKAAPAAGKPAAPTAATPAAAPPAQSNGSGTYSAEEISENTRFALMKVGETRPGQSMSLPKLATVTQTTALPQMAKDIPAAQHKAILANIKSAGWMGINIDGGGLPGWVIEGDTVTFPAAE
jgi:hypothetical protein